MVDRGQRKPQDFYETPPCLTRTFLDSEFTHRIDQNATVLNPACGDGALSKVLKEYGYDVTEYDLNQGIDFLKETRKFDWVIENIPYSLSYEFINKAKEVATEGFAFLLPLSYLQGSRRFHEVWMDDQYPLESIYVFNRFPMMGEPLREDGKIGTGMMALAWYVWVYGYAGEPTIHWLDIDPYILRKENKRDAQ
jgi:hypothetical protein